MLKIYIVALFYLLHVTSGEDVPGGIMDKDPNDPKYKELAEESLQKYVKDSHIVSPLKVVSVDHASEQIVAGLLTRIDFKIMPDVDGWVGPAQICNSEIWEKSWEHFKNITKVLCVLR